MSRGALKQRSLSEINIDAGNNSFHDEVSGIFSNYTSTPTDSTAIPSPGYTISSRTSYANSPKLHRVSASDSIRDVSALKTVLTSRYGKIPSRENSQKSRSSSPEKKIPIQLVTVEEFKERSVSGKSGDSRNSSGAYAPPPYSPPPHTPTIRLIPKTPPASLSRRHSKQIIPLDESSLFDSSVSENIKTVLTTEYTHSAPSPIGDIVRQEVDEPSHFLNDYASPLTPFFDRPNDATRSLLSSSSESFSGRDVTNRLSSSFEYPSIPEIPRPVSTIRLVPKTPPAATPSSVRNRSVSYPNPRSPTEPTSRPSTASTSLSRPRSRSSEHRPISPLAQIRESSSQRLSQISFQSSVDAIGLPPSRPLPLPPLGDQPRSPGLRAIPRPPTPPDTPQPRSTIRLVEKTPPTVNTSKGYLKPILKKKASNLSLPPSISSDGDGSTSPIDTSEHSDIRPALDWIFEKTGYRKTSNRSNLEAKQADTTTKGVRMQFNPDEEPVYPDDSFDNIIPSPMVGPSRWFSQSTSSGESPISAVTSPSVVPQRVGNTRNYVGKREKEQSYYSTAGEILHRRKTSKTRRSSSFSAFMRTERWDGETSSSGDSLRPGSSSRRPTIHRQGLSRRSSSLSVLSQVGIPEWAKLYYGRGKHLPHIGEDDDQRRMTQPDGLGRMHTNQSRASSVWTGVINREGQPVLDQFNQPRLDNTPVNRAERLNPHLIMFVLGFIFPLAWMAGAAYPLPKQKRLTRREMAQTKAIARRSGIPAEWGPGEEREEDVESLPSFDTFEESRRWDNARWWRNINRGMSVIALLIIGGVIALAVVGTMRSRATS